MPIKRIFSKKEFAEKNRVELDEPSRQNFLYFLHYQNIKNEKGEPLDFRNHLYLLDIYDDFSPQQVIMKSAQVGISTMMINKLLYLAGVKGLEVIYTLPAQSSVNRFVRSKVNRIINANPVYRSWVADTDNVQQKLINNSICYFQGTYTEQETLMITGDVLICDEYDRSNINTIEQYESRLQHSKYRWKWYLSNPSIAGYGIDYFFSFSDQKHWFFKCPHCNKWQYPSFPDNISEKTEEGYYYVCKKCKQEITFNDIRKGQWVQKYLNREISGYWIPAFLSPLMTADKIMEYKEKKDEGYFYNFVMGLPVSETDEKVTEETFANLFTNTYEGFEAVGMCMGVDVGIKKHYVIGNHQGVYEVGETESWADIEYLMYKYNIQVCVIDILPDITIPRQLAEKYPNRVFLCSLHNDRQTYEIIKWHSGGESSRVSVDRNRGIQLLIDNLNAEKIKFWGHRQKYSKLINHFTSMVKKVDNKDKVIPKIEWFSTGQDHYVFATLFWMIAMDRYQVYNQAEIIKI